MNATRPSPRIMIVTGEASGDLHGAKLIRAIRALDASATFLGAGGTEMAAAGCEILVGSERLAVMGLVEVLGHFPDIRRAFGDLKKAMAGPGGPDALVLIDSPEFNLRLARHAQRLGIPVIYYVSPQVWAWRRGRVRKIARVVDRLAAIFPFEPELYSGLDIDVEYVGHPLLDEFEVGQPRSRFLARLGLDPAKQVVGLFPGSRRTELKYMLETVVETARRLHEADPALDFLVPVAGTLRRDEIAPAFGTDLPVTFVDAEEAGIYDVVNACDAVLTVSGTVTLQIALTGVPMVIFYQLAPLSYAIGRRLIRVDHIGLANIVAGERIAPEYIQDEASPANLAKAILDILNDEEVARRMRTALREVRKSLGEPGCSARVARMVLKAAKPKEMGRPH